VSNLAKAAKRFKKENHTSDKDQHVARALRRETTGGAQGDTAVSQQKKPGDSCGACLARDWRWWLPAGETSQQDENEAKQKPGGS
jgi:hypothetical protein